ncbi:MAG: hypothetical protein IIT36_06095 [Aeriscardovia sp.]|nr:hypothetical protein [Aeriscardovia sp.]
MFFTQAAQTQLVVTGEHAPLHTLWHLRLTRTAIGVRVLRREGEGAVGVAARAGLEVAAAFDVIETLVTVEMMTSAVSGVLIMMVVTAVVAETTVTETFTAQRIVLSVVVAALIVAVKIGVTTVVMRVAKVATMLLITVAVTAIITLTTVIATVVTVPIAAPAVVVEARTPAPVAVTVSLITIGKTVAGMTMIKVATGVARPTSAEWIVVAARTASMFAVAKGTMRIMAVPAFSESRLMRLSAFAHNGPPKTPWKRDRQPWAVTLRLFDFYDK